MSRQTIEIKVLRAGQPRAYADSFYEAEIRVANFWDSTTGEQEGSWSANERQVRELARLFVHGFDDEGKVGFLAPYLKEIEHVGPKLWRVLIVEPYCD